MSGATVRCTFVPAVKPAPGRAVPKVVRSPKPNGPSRTARMLALAHHIERLIDDGVIPDYAAAARALGVTRARLTQVMNLLLLAPEVQEQVLAGEIGGSERRLRAVIAQSCWATQAAITRVPERGPLSRGGKRNQSIGIQPA